MPSRLRTVPTVVGLTLMEWSKSEQRGGGGEKGYEVSQRSFKALRYGAAQTTLVKNGNAPCSSASGKNAVSS